MSTYIITNDGRFYTSDYLCHHGIKGMKWGVRRYQNEDGTLTAAGKERLRGEVEKAYRKSSNMREFGKTLVSQKGMRSYLLGNDSASELSRKTTRYITDARRINYDANLAANKEAKKAVGGKDFAELLLSKDADASEKISLYLETGKRVAKEYGEKMAPMMNKRLSELDTLRKSYEKEANAFVRDFLGEYGNTEVSYSDAIKYDMKNNKITKQTMSEMTVASLLSYTGAIAVEEMVRKSKK